MNFIIEKCFDVFIGINRKQYKNNLKNTYSYNCVSYLQDLLLINNLKCSLETLNKESNDKLLLKKMILWLS